MSLEMIGRLQKGLDDKIARSIQLNEEVEAASDESLRRELAENYAELIEEMTKDKNEIA